MGKVILALLVVAFIGDNVSNKYPVALIGLHERAGTERRFDFIFENIPVFNNVTKTDWACVVQKPCVINLKRVAQKMVRFTPRRDVLKVTARSKHPRAICFHGFFRIVGLRYVEKYLTCYSRRLPLINSSTRDGHIGRMNLTRAVYDNVYVRNFQREVGPSLGLPNFTRVLCHGPGCCQRQIQQPCPCDGENHHDPLSQGILGGNQSTKPIPPIWPAAVMVLALIILGSAMGIGAGVSIYGWGVILKKKDRDHANSKADH